ncbi:MAG: hypothetical protein IPP42_01575 [Saprospiraceae bacterium]|nr:hypothetical protein [Saprospiraceae bacterium]
MTDACYNKRDTMIKVCDRRYAARSLAIEDTKVTVDPATCWSPDLCAGSG